MHLLCWGHCSITFLKWWDRQWCRCVSSICDEVAPDCDPESIGILLLGLVVDNDPRVSPLVSCRHDKHWIHSFLACFVVPLCHSTKILSKCCLPYFGSFRIFHQPFVAWYGFSRGRMYHRWCKVRKIWDIVFVRYGDECAWGESRWGCKCFLHCHCVECLLANQSCTCSCPPTQHSVRGNYNHWCCGVFYPVRPACLWCCSCIREYQRRCYALNCRYRSWCIISCDPPVSVCIFYQISLSRRLHDRRGIRNSCYWHNVLIFALCFHLTNVIVHLLFAPSRWR